MAGAYMAGAYIDCNYFAGKLFAKYNSDGRQGGHAIKRLS
jgi:hypothetical protein